MTLIFIGFVKLISRKLKFEEKNGNTKATASKYSHLTMMNIII